jgi:uncharacterized membrane protein (UPF0127 family)
MPDPVLVRAAHQVSVYNRTRHRLLAAHATLADTYLGRLIGLLGKTGRWCQPGCGLWIVPSHGVHTLGMMFSIDVVFLDREHHVLHLVENMRPFRVSAVKLRAVSVLELPPHTITETGTCVGDRLEILPAAPSLDS